MSGVPEVGFNVPLSHSSKSAGIAKEKEVSMRFQKEPEPSVKTNRLQSHRNRLRPIVNKFNNLISAFGGDSTDTEFFSEGIPSAPGEGVFMQVNAHKRLTRK